MGLSLKGMKLSRVAYLQGIIYFIPMIWINTLILMEPVLSCKSTILDLESKSWPVEGCLVHSASFQTPADSQIKTVHLDLLRIEMHVSL